MSPYFLILTASRLSFIHSPPPNRLRVAVPSPWDLLRGGAGNEVSKPVQESIFDYHLFSVTNTMAPGTGGGAVRHTFMHKHTVHVSVICAQHILAYSKSHAASTSWVWHFRPMWVCKSICKLWCQNTETSWCSRFYSRLRLEYEYKIRSAWNWWQGSVPVKPPLQTRHSDTLQ